MSGIFGRAKKRTSVYHNTVKNALGPSPEFTELSRNRVRSSSEIVGQATSRKGKILEVISVIEEYHESSLDSFLPSSLKCLDSCLPSLLLNHPSDIMAAPTVAQNVIGELSRMQTDAPSGLHTLAFLGGLLLLVSSALNVVEHVMKLGPLHTFFAVVMFIFAVLILTLEQQRALFSPWFRNNLEQYFLFVTLIAGRGGFYVYIGMTQAAVNWRRSSFSVAVGLYIIFIGSLYIQTGISVSTKLTQLRDTLQSPQAIERAFNNADEDGDGTLDRNELIQLMATLGSTMTEKEAETCIEVMDKADKFGIKDHKLSLDEFMVFMERDDTSHFF